MRQMETKNWCVEWFGSQGDFIAGKADEAVSLEHFAGLESLYAVGPLEQARGEVSIYDGVPLISEVQDGQINVTIDSYRHAGFLVYAIVENWRRVTVRAPIKTEQQLEDQLLAWAVTSGIDVDEPFAFLLNGLVAQATFHVLCNRGRGRYNADNEKSKVRFPIANESVEVVGFTPGTIAAFLRRGIPISICMFGPWIIAFRDTSRRLTGSMASCSIFPLTHLILLELI